MKNFRLISILLITFLLSGCLKTVNNKSYFSERITETYFRSRWLLFIKPDTTTREQVEERLGPPSSVFENGRIYTYRIIINEWPGGLSEKIYSGYYNLYVLPTNILESVAATRIKQVEKQGALLVISEENMERYEKEIISTIGEFHLVLVFSGNGILSKNSLIRIHP